MLALCPSCFGACGTLTVVGLFELTMSFSHGGNPLTRNSKQIARPNAASDTRVPVGDETQYATVKIGQSKSGNPKAEGKFWFFGGRNMGFAIFPDAEFPSEPLPPPSPEPQRPLTG